MLRCEEKRSRPSAFTVRTCNAFVVSQCVSRPSNHRVTRRTALSTSATGDGLSCRRIRRSEGVCCDLCYGRSAHTVRHARRLQRNLYIPEMTTVTAHENRCTCPHTIGFCGSRMIRSRLSTYVIPIVSMTRAMTAVRTVTTTLANPMPAAAAYPAGQLCV